MSVAAIVAAALFLGVLAYAVLAGADFGAGFFDLIAGGAQRGRHVRTLVDHSIGPVWEANHVWLIFALVIWWTAFPTSFASAMTTLTLPLLLALLGIVLRGAGFAFRKYAPTLGYARVFGIIFATSSVLTPFFLGTVAGGIASGRVPSTGEGDVWSSWLNATSLFGGVIAVGTCATLAGTFLTADAARGGQHALAEQLRNRSLIIASITGTVVFVALVPLYRDAPTLSHGLSGQAAPLIVVSAAAGIATLALLTTRRYDTARFTAIAAVGTVVAGWGVGQYPWLLVDQLTIAQAAGAPATLRALLITIVLAGVLVLPPLAYLLYLTQTSEWTQAAATARDQSATTSKQ